MASCSDEAETGLNEEKSTLDEVETRLSLYVGLEYEPAFEEKLHNLKKVNTIIMSVGEVASIFCRSLYFTETYEKVARIVSKICEKRKQVAEIFYDESSGTLLIICDVKCDETAIPIALSITAFLFSQHIIVTPKKHCVILTSQYITLYKQSAELSEQDESFVKTYATFKYMNTCPVEVIDHPYIPGELLQNGENVSVGDVLLDMCVKTGVTAILYVCYTLHNDPKAVEVLESARNNPLLSQVPTNSDGHYVNAYKTSLKLLGTTSSFS